ncbi:hypothetical protein Tco_0163418 [Tanacetum coccineum]
MPTYRTMLFNDTSNEKEIRLNQDLLQERRETKYKKKVEQYYNKRVRLMAFKVADFVYRMNEASRVENQGKLDPTWEGPYRVIEAYQNNSYKLGMMDDKETSFIQDVPEVMRISAFMSNSKCLELVRHFQDLVPRSVTEMMQRVDDFVKSEEAFQTIDLPKGKFPNRGPGQPNLSGPNGHDMKKLPKEMPIIVDRSAEEKPRCVCVAAGRHDRSSQSLAVTKEVAEWMKAGIIRPIWYPTWISNLVLVQKVNGTWRMCIDFKSINSACLKDYYPLPEIDLKIKTQDSSISTF